MDSNWDKREQFLNEIRSLLNKVPLRKAFYPGAQKRHADFLVEPPKSERIGLPVLDAGSYAFGYLAAGNFSGGVFAIGIFSIGIFSIGILNIGIFAVGIYAIRKYANKLVSSTEEDKAK